MEDDETDATRALMRRPEYPVTIGELAARKGEALEIGRRTSTRLIRTRTARLPVPLSSAAGLRRGRHRPAHRDTQAALGEEEASAGDLCACEIQKARADELHQFGLWIADHFKLPVGYGA